MSAPDNRDETAAEEVQQPAPRYGDALVNGRKRFALNVDNICEELNISREIIEQIERSATTDIPPATFMQGYIRAYARLVDVNADNVLADFARAVPDESSPLRARSNLPKEATSRSPVIRNITRLLLLCGVLAVIYGIYSYYSEKLQSFDDVPVETVEDTGEGVKLEIRQQARLTPDGDLLLEQPAPNLMQQEMQMIQQQAEADPVIDESEPEPETEQELVAGDSVITIYADSDSWVEITSADNKRLHYNLLKAGEEVSLSGVAPFSVFLGNAPEVTMMLNNRDVIFKNYVRANKTAKFRISTEDGELVFHKR